MEEDVYKRQGNGQLNVMPWTLEPLYVYYRPSYFEKAGVSVPETFDQWLECIEKCTMDTDGDGQTDVYGYCLLYTSRCV